MDEIGEQTFVLPDHPKEKVNKENFFSDEGLMEEIIRS